MVEGVKKQIPFFF